MSSDDANTSGTYNIPTVCPKCGIALELKERHCRDTGNSHIIACCTSHGWIYAVPQPKLHEIQSYRSKVSEMLKEDSPAPNEKFLMWMVKHGLKEYITRRKAASVKASSAVLRAQSAAGYRALKRYREGRAAHAKGLSPQYQVQVVAHFPEPPEAEDVFLLSPQPFPTFAFI